MSPVEAFRAELARTAARSTDPVELLPDRLTQACVAVLPFDGAGLSFTLTPDRRLPWEASDPVAATAERLQFALGDGPCAAAHRERISLFTDWESLRARWPVYATELAEQTAYRCTLALPVGGPLTGVGVLVLYRRRSGPLVDGVLDVVRGIADEMGAALADGLRAGTEVVLEVPTALDSPAVLARQRVWTAIGFLSGQRAIPSTQALALLRGLAFSRNTDLETVAESVLGGDLLG